MAAVLPANPTTNAPTDAYSNIKRLNRWLKGSKAAACGAVLLAHALYYLVAAPRVHEKLSAAESKDTSQLLETLVKWVAPAVSTALSILPLLAVLRTASLKVDLVNENFISAKPKFRAKVAFIFVTTVLMIVTLYVPYMTLMNKSFRPPASMLPSSLKRFESDSAMHVMVMLLVTNSLFILYNAFAMRRLIASVLGRIAIAVVTNPQKLAKAGLGAGLLLVASLGVGFGAGFGSRGIMDDIKNLKKKST